MIAVHIETKLVTTGTKLQELSSNVKNLHDTQEAYLKAVAPIIQTMSLAQGFATVSRQHVRWTNLRIFAVSSQQILTFFRSHRFIVDNCELLIRADPRDKRTRAWANSSRLLVQEWRTLEREGYVGKLTVRSYDFFPTEYECIFDEKVLLLGLYESDPDDHWDIKVGNVTLVEDSTPYGRHMIQEYRSRFDKLFDVCATHHGPDYFSN